MLSCASSILGGTMIEKYKTTISGLLLLGM
jgi:hypothetical protein